MIQRILSATLALLLAVFCTHAQQPFPATIKVSGTKDLRRIKGSKLFVSAPASYTAVESMIRMQRDNNTYIQVLEAPGSPFGNYKKNMTKEAIEAKGAKVDIVMPVTYNGYDALYLSGPSKFEGETKLSLAFGNDDFIVMVVGVCKTADKQGMDELNKILSNSYYDASFALDPMELATYKFDATITGFKYATSMANVHIYTPNGKEDLGKEQPDLPTMQFFTIEAPTFAKAQEFMETVISKHSAGGVQMSDVVKKEVTINGAQGYEVTMTAKDDKSTSILYNLIVQKGTQAVLFMAADTPARKWLEKYKATAHSIKM